MTSGSIRFVVKRIQIYDPEPKRELSETSAKDWG